MNSLFNKIIFFTLLIFTIVLIGECFEGKLYYLVLVIMGIWSCWLQINNISKG